MTDFVDGHPRRSRRVRHDPIETHGGALDPVAAGVADLSRRFVSVRMPYVSFREYLVLRGEVDFGVHDAFHEPPDWLHEIAGSLNVLKLFEGYMEHGTRHMFTEGVDSYGIRESRNPGSIWIDAYARYGRLYRRDP